MPLYISFVTEEELLGPDTGQAGVGLPWPISAAPCSQQVRRRKEAQRHACPVPTVSRKTVRRKLCSQKKEQEASARRKWAETAGPSESSRKNKKVGWRMCEGSFAHPTGFMTPGCCDHGSFSRTSLLGLHRKSDDYPSWVICTNLQRQRG